jgi:hypothetical protein
MITETNLAEASLSPTLYNGEPNGLWRNATGGPSGLSNVTPWQFEWISL